MLIVCAEVALVEAELVGGLLGCPSCREVLGPWGHARQLPRLINNHAVASLIAAFAAKQPIVDESAARTAVAEISAE